MEMNNEISIRVGKWRTGKMRLTEWKEGAALIAVDNAGRPAAMQSARVFAWNRRTGEVQRYRQVGLENEFIESDKR